MLTDPRITAVTTDCQFGSTIGIRFDRQRALAHAALISSTGNLQRDAPEILATVHESLFPELMRRIRDIELGSSTSGERAAISAEITEIAIRLAQSLLGQVGDAAKNVLAIGSHGCGVWNCGGPQRSHRGLCNSAVLAEETGITVIDEFPARDLAQGGLGGPVEAHGLWLLLADRTPVPGRRWRAVLEVAPYATQCTLVGPFDSKAKKEPPFAKNICTGQRLFSLLTSASADSATDFDYEKLAPQGKSITELIEIWTTAGSSHPDWQPDGVSALPLTYALESSVYRNSGVPDLLATATRYLAGEIATFVRHCIDHSQPVGELLIMGEGTRNGLLIHWLGDLLPAVRLRLLNESKSEPSILAASIAALALLHVWQIPLMPSRGGVPRVLGRLTPGSPSNWRRVLSEMTLNSPSLLPLREAI